MAAALHGTKYSYVVDFCYWLLCIHLEEKKYSYIATNKRLNSRIKLMEGYKY